MISYSPRLIVTVLLLSGFCARVVAQDPDRILSPSSDTLARQLRVTGAERWYKNCFIYNLDVHTFQDSDGDGVGDFRGLTGRLAYLKKLGVDVIWLAPFQPSPHKDDGYDVMDYYGVDPGCGSAGDFAEFIFKAHSLGIRVMMDMILSHTSDQHPWFKLAAADSTSPFHDWYFWSAKRPVMDKTGVAFPGVQKETWTWQPVAHSFYFHRFYDFQPHLNFTNPKVMEEAEKVLGYWLDQGVDGFRIDAAPFMVEVPKVNGTDADHTLTAITALRQFVQWRRGDALLLGEANVAPAEFGNYFGETGDRLHMLFNFYGNQFLFYSLATHDASTLRSAMEKSRIILPVSQWCWFLRNHDEIDLGRLTDAQRKEVYNAFGPSRDMQLYDRGIRRRLAPMLHNQKQLEMAYSLLFALPGSEEIHYGEELGMGDDLSLKERLAVRTPMQWSEERNAGFSSAQNIIRPVIKGEYGYDRVNVEEEEGDSNSLLEKITWLARIRKDCPEIGLGQWTIPDSTEKSLLILRYDYEGNAVLTVHNFDAKPRRFNFVDAIRPDEEAKDLLTGRRIAAGQKKEMVNIPGFGYKWYRLKRVADR